MAFKLINVIARKCKDGTVEIFKENGDAFCKFPSHYSNKPDYRFKTIILDCFSWNLVWIKGLHEPLSTPFHVAYGAKLDLSTADNLSVSL